MKSTITLIFNTFFLLFFNLCNSQVWMSTNYNTGGPVQGLTSDVSNVTTIDVTIGNASSYDDSPFFTGYSDAKIELLYLASEIYSYGGVSGEISRIGFNVFSYNNVVMNGFKIKMQNTNITNLSGITNSGWTVVYQGSYVVSGTGWKYIDLQTPFEWNGIDNLLVEICFDNNEAGNGTSNVYTSNHNSNLRFRQYMNNGVGCDLTSQGFSSASTFRADLALRIHPFPLNSPENLNMTKNRILAGNESGRVHWTDDLGLNWTMSSANLNSVNCFGINKSSGLMFAGTYSNGIWSSSTNGTSWSPNGLSGKSIWNIVVKKSNSYIFATNAGSSNGIYRSTNNGSSWDLKGFQSNIPWSLTTNELNGKIYCGTIDIGLAFSNDDGESWGNLGLSNRDIYSLAINPYTNELYAGTDFGLFRTTNEGGTWTEVLNPGSRASCLLIDRDEHLYAGFRDGGGIYRSTNHGINWSAYNEGLESSNIYSLCADSIGYIYTGTGNSGRVFRTINLAMSPRKPILVSPLNYSTEISLTPSLDWDDITGSNNYRVQLSTDSIFNETDLDSELSNSFVNVPFNLSNNTKYFWRVNASNNSGISHWSVVWNFKTMVSTNTKINITLTPEGTYFPSLIPILRRKDSVTVWIRNNTSPYIVIDSILETIDSLNFTRLFIFENVPTGTYYITVRPFSCIETWSKSGGELLVSNGSIYNYNFTTAISQAYGNNMIPKGSGINTKYCIYSGDVNKDGVIDGTDLSIIDNDAFEFTFGRYERSDLNGDNYVEGSDLSIADNNVSQFIGVISP